MTYAEETISISEIIKGQLYLGNLPSAFHPPPSLHITHILSICPDYPSTGPHHLTIPINDTEYDDLLIHLPRACEFIRKAIEDDGGRVLVHCVMGVSRSAAVVVAYLMRTTLRTPLLSLLSLQKKRPQAHPNYGFLKQLEAFEECGYAPSPTHPSYIAWRRRARRDVGRYLNCVGDVVLVKVGGGEVFFTSEFPSETYASSTLLLTLGATHLLTLSPSQLSTTLSSLSARVQHKHINVSNTDRASLLLALPECAEWIKQATEGGGVVLVHSLVESRGVAALCAAVMVVEGKGVEEGFRVVDDALPLFNPTRTLHRTLDLFHLTSHNPTPTHPLVRAWLKEEGWDAWSRASYEPKEGFRGRRGSNESAKSSSGSEGGSSGGSGSGKNSMWGSEESTPWGSASGSRATTPDIDEPHHKVEVPLASPPPVQRTVTAPVTTRYTFTPSSSSSSSSNKNIQNILSPSLTTLHGYFAPQHQSTLDEVDPSPSSQSMQNQYGYLEESGIDMSAFGETLKRLGVQDERVLGAVANMGRSGKGGNVGKMKRADTGDLGSIKSVFGREGREGRRLER